MGNTENKSSKKQGKSSATDSVTDYKYSPRVANPDPKASQNKAPSSGNIKGM